MHLILLALQKSESRWIELASYEQNNKMWL